MESYDLAWVKRESGENPERSRHCVREFAFIITELFGKRKQMMIEVRRPAYSVIKDLRTFES